MTVHKLTAGDGYVYLTRQVAAQDVTARGRGGLGSYYSEKGEAPGVWMGRGLAAVPDFPVGAHVTEAQMTALFGEGRHPNADVIERAARHQGLSEKEVDAASRLGKPYLVYEAGNAFRRRCAEAYRDHNTTQGLRATTAVPDDVRAGIRTRIATEMFAETYGRAPADARELHGHLARISRQATTAVAGYDLTFSPVKSVSTLWAIARPDIAKLIEQAHHDAVADTLTWLEDHAAYTRIGSAGIAQVEVQGLIAAAFTHRDSRAGDPDLHTHVAISNKVQTLDGRWYALDGRAIYQHNVTASERYNTRIEALLTQRLGVVFADRTDGDPGKRPVREIVGIDGPLPRAWSTRRAAITTRRAQLSATFQLDHGRPPTPKEAIALAQQATLATRQRKHEPRSYADQRATWRAEALTVLGGEARLHYYLRDALRGGPRHYTGRSTGQPGRRPPAHVTRAWVEHAADTVLTTVSAQRATWQAHHLRAEAERHARTTGVAYADLDTAVDGVVAAAVSPARCVLLDDSDPITAAEREPAGLRRSDGTSVFTVAGSARYTTPEILAAEHTIITTAGLRDGRRVPAEVVEVALRESATTGVVLNPGQVQLVRELATSGARVQLTLAPAGTGKTAAMRALAHAWAWSGGTVLGLAPSAAAAAVLRDELTTTGTGAIAAGGVPTDTLAKLIWHLDNPDGTPPAWISTIGPDSLVIIDEAGMASTPHLATAIAHITGRGGSVRLVGDTHQLAAIGAGGVLRDLAQDHGAVTLSQVMRFTHPTGHPHAGAPNHAEAAASLALRDGDPAAIAYYLDHGRVHVGDLATATTDAYQAWATDSAGGVDSIMLAPTRELVAELNVRARTDRLAQSTPPVGREVILADGTRASAGDTIITGKNNRHLRLSPTDYVKNGDRWRITAVRADGGLDVTHLRTRGCVTLPAPYVQQHVRLGYAATVHGAQGITADTCHVVATGQETRQLLYVAMTRGRHANHVYLTTTSDGDPHTLITRDTLLPPTAGDILTRILSRDTSPTSATSISRDLTRPDLLLAAAAARYHHALTVAADDHLGPDRQAHLDATADTLIPGITRADAYPTLRAHLALLTLDGHDPAQVFTHAVSSSAGRGLADARDVAAVLDWRLHQSDHHPGGPGPLPWLPSIPTALLEDPEWGGYLQARADLVTDLAKAVAEKARAWTPATAPAWVTPFIENAAESDPELVADLAVWRASHGIDATDRRPTGDPHTVAADARVKRALDQRVTRLFGDPDTATSAWTALADSIDPRITTDPYWPTLADHLTALERTGIPLTALTRAVAANRPLPDEQPAAALWWRLIAHLSPAATNPTGHSELVTLRPDWTPVGAEVVGESVTGRIVANPTSVTADLALAAADTADVWRTGDTVADVLAALDEADQRRWDAEQDRAHFWATAAVPRARLVELNALAEEFFTRHYADDWAADYLRDRLGANLTDNPRVSVGYAPNSWTALTQHLRRQGATDLEILETGLGVRSSTGSIIDRFRDRLVFPIKALDPDDANTLETRGFIGRRNPTATDDGHAGPKYHNTPDTDLFTKGQHLYGLADNTAALTAGATVVLVEGPLDALAVTLAGANPDGTVSYVGVAPLGTAFTDTQADLLRPYVSTRPRANDDPGRAPIIVATDNDPAGHHAAHRAFWQLVARGEDPHRLRLPHGKDPAELLQTHGRAALRAALDTAIPLADQITADRTAPLATRLDTLEGRLQATRWAADVLGARPPTTWADGATGIAARYGVALPTAITEVLDAGHAWTDDPRGLALQGLAERPPNPAPTPTPSPAEQPAKWAEHITSLTHIDVTTDTHWPALADHLARAEATGYDIPHRLPVLLARRPLDTEHALRDLDTRLITDHSACRPPTDPTVHRDSQAHHDQAAARRRTIADRHTAHQQLRTPPPAATPIPAARPRPAATGVPAPSPIPRPAQQAPTPTHQRPGPRRPGRTR